MCDPSIISLGAQAFGGGMSTVGAFMGAQSQKSSLRYQAQMDEINARLAEGNARNAISAGIVEESRVKLRGSQAKSTQIAEMAHSGIDIAGSPTAIARLTGNDVITEVDANTVRANALRAAWGQRIEASNYRADANSKTASASSISPFLAGLTSLVSSAGQVASSWYTMNTQGAFGGKTAAPAKTGLDDWKGLLQNQPGYAEIQPGQPGYEAAHPTFGTSGGYDWSAFGGKTLAFGKGY